MLHVTTSFLTSRKG